MNLIGNILALSYVDARVVVLAELNLKQTSQVRNSLTGISKQYRRPFRSPDE